MQELHEWEVHRASGGRGLFATGRLYHHGRIPDGTHIRTPRIKKIDPDQGILETPYSTYKLVPTPTEEPSWLLI